MRRIIVFTGTRADWGILSSVARSLNKRADVDLTVAATNMHLSERFGHTVDEIRADGFEPLTFAMDADAATPRQRVEAMAECMAGAAGILDRIKPGLAVILGDRFEMLACATACAMTGVPIAHVAGGEISEGAIDDSLRHAITKLSALHLTATEPYRHRVIAMGEDPARVFNTGALGVGNLRSLPDEAPLEELEELTGFPVGHRTILVTYHAATLDTGDIDIFLACVSLEEEIIYIALVIFIVSLTLLILLCLSLIFAILTPALLKFLRCLYDFVDQFLCQDFLLFDFLTDLRMLCFEHLKHIILELFNLCLLYT